jgi:uncharacterized membrane protein
MNTSKTLLSKTVDAKVAQKPQIVEMQSAAQNTSTEELTFGQRLADKFATQVGSWGFLIGQSTVLAGWVSLNLMPGFPTGMSHHS